MGLNNFSGGNITFLTITNGKLVRQVKQPTGKSVERVNKVGRTVYEEFYDSMDGIISAIDIKESEYGKFWVITLKSDSETYKLEFNYSGGYAMSFLKTLPNVDLTKPVTLTPRLNIDGDKKQAVLFVSQNGKALKHYWNKDNPGDLPPLDKIKVKGKDVYDDSRRLEFFENYAKSLTFNSVIPEVIDDETTPF